MDFCFVLWICLATTGIAAFIVPYSQRGHQEFSSPACTSTINYSLFASPPWTVLSSGSHVRSCSARRDWHCAGARSLLEEHLRFLARVEKTQPGRTRVLRLPPTVAVTWNMSVCCLSPYPPIPRHTHQKKHNC